MYIRIYSNPLEDLRSSSVSNGPLNRFPRLEKDNKKEREKKR